MFNKQPFNTGKFNTTTVAESLSGSSLLKLSTKPLAGSMTISSIGSNNMRMLSPGVTHVKGLFGTAAPATMVFAANRPSATISLFTYPNPAAMMLGMDASQTLSGEEVVELLGINLQPGEELVINTCDMTVTVNGQNRMKHFTDQSAFFNLLSGDNTIEYADNNTSRNVSFNMIWKDRWL